MRLVLIVAAAAALAACQPSAPDKAAPAGSEPQPEGKPAPAGPPVAAAMDWHFMTHGGSADLDYGDGDWAEGVSQFHMSCLPNSKTVEASLAKDGQATLMSGGQSVTIEADSSTAADTAALVAFRASGSLSVAQGGPFQVFNATEAGKGEVEKFFAYCTKPPA